MQDKPLTGKVAIVTGAGSPIGMGRAMTFALVRAGARVAMLDINEVWLEQSANEVRAIGGDDSVLALVCDVSDPESAEDAVRKTIAGLGDLHVLINNAGTINLADLSGGNQPNFWDITPETWNKIVAVNFSGAFYMTRAVARPHARPEVGTDNKRHDQRRHHVPGGYVSLWTVKGWP